MSDESRYEDVRLEGELVRRSDKAALIRYVDASGAEREEWIPRSQMKDQEWVDKEAYLVCCNIPRWLAEDRGVV